jgi:hypothetical protein
VILSKNRSNNGPGNVDSEIPWWISETIVLLSSKTWRSGQWSLGLYFKWYKAKYRRLVASPPAHVRTTLLINIIRVCRLASARQQDQSGVWSGYASHRRSNSSLFVGDVRGSPLQ